MTSTDAAGLRTVHRPEDARYFESDNRGPGALASPSRRRLSRHEAGALRERVLDGWDPGPD